MKSETLEKLKSEDAKNLIGVGPCELVSTQDLADTIGLSARSINSLTQSGVIEAAERGRYDLRETVRRYCEHLRKRGNENLDREKIRLTREQADKIELQNEKARGDLLDVAEVEKEWASILRDVRAGMLAVSSRVQQRVGHLSAHDLEAIDREIRGALTVLGGETSSESAVKAPQASGEAL